MTTVTVTNVSTTRAPEMLKRPARVALRQYGRLTSKRRPAPDFLLIGTKRGGTTSMWHNVLAHPAVMPMFPTPRLKSPHFFDMNYTRGMAWYRSHFATMSERRAVAARLGADPVAGESSPYYMYHPLVAERVARDLPEAKIIVLLRDPVERAYSHWKERSKEGVETLTFEDALAAEGERTEGEVEKIRNDPSYYSLAHDSFSYRARGRYIEHLSPWLSLVPAEQLLILVSEDFYADPRTVYRQVENFLGIPHHEVEEFKHHNYTPRRGVPERLVGELAEYYQPSNKAIESLLGRELPWTRADPEWPGASQDVGRRVSEQNRPPASR